MTFVMNMTLSAARAVLAIPPLLQDQLQNGNTIKTTLLFAAAVVLLLLFVYGVWLGAMACAQLCQ